MTEHDDLEPRDDAMRAMAWPFSANTGFLWPSLPFLDRLERAASVGFSLVEFHDEAQREDLATLQSRLESNGLRVAGLNVAMGDTAGCAALAGEEARARTEIADAIEIADALDASAVHVLSGRTGGVDEAAARARYVDALRFALKESGGTILIEPLCPQAMPGYHVDTFDKAVSIIEEIGEQRLGILFDTFHAAHLEGDVAAAFARLAPYVAHVQIASFPARAEPLVGGTDHERLLPAMRAAGYAGAFGCEYRQQGSDAADRTWRESLPPPPPIGRPG